MKQDNFTQRLRQRLADYEEPAPDDLWAGIEARLPQQTKRRQARVIPVWGRWAAAVVVVLMGAAGVLWNTPDNSPEMSMESQISANSEGQGVLSEKVSEPVAPMPEIVSRIPMKSAVFAAIPVSTVSQETPESLESPASSEKPSSPDVPATSEAQEQPVPSTEPVHEQAATQVIYAGDLASPKRRNPRSRPAFSLYASNGFGNQQGANGVLMSPSLLANYDHSLSRTRADAPVYLYGYEERQKDYQPVSFGLTANFPISSGLSLLAGVVYTRLRSDFVYIASAYRQTKEQTLHYVGVPLALQYRLWQTGALSLYAVAGGQADYNVKADLSVDDISQEMSRDRWQFSLQGAVGVQYDVIPQLGVYVEPGVKHYFDNGSPVHNFFKERPTSFNLQVGLRLNLGNP